MTDIPDSDIVEQHADFCSVLCNPNRLKLFHLLSHDEYSVTELAERSGLPQSTVSQHLRTMRDKSTVTRRKEGNRALYRLSDERLIEALETIREVLEEDDIVDNSFSWRDS